MIKDVMVRLDGSSGDDARLAAATQISEIFQSHITGLFFNVMTDEFNGANVNRAAHAPDAARRAGDAVETMLFQRLTRLQQPTNLRRFDVTSVLDISGTALPVVRTADTPQSISRTLCELPANRSVTERCHSRSCQRSCGSWSVTVASSRPSLH